MSVAEDIKKVTAQIAQAARVRVPRIQGELAAIEAKMAAIEAELLKLIPLILKHSPRA